MFLFVVFCSLYLCSCLLENDDEAITILVNHFRTVITDIKESKWSHFIAAQQVERKGSRGRSSTASQWKRGLERNPVPFLLQRYRCEAALLALRMKVSRSLKSFEHKQVTPVLKTIFGDASIGVESSGIELLFPSVRRGRPRPTAGLSLRREIANIVCQARDIKTSKLHVLVRWTDESVPARWLSLDLLDQQTLQWWEQEFELRFPFTADVAIPLLEIPSTSPSDFAGLPVLRLDISSN